MDDGCEIELARVVKFDELKQTSREAGEETRLTRELLRTRFAAFARRFSLNDYRRFDVDFPAREQRRSEELFARAQRPAPAEPARGNSPSSGFPASIMAGFIPPAARGCVGG